MRNLEKIVLILMSIFLLGPVGAVLDSSAQDQLKQTVDSILVVLKNPEFQNESQQEKRREKLGKIYQRQKDQPTHKKNTNYYYPCHHQKKFST